MKSLHTAHTRTIQISELLTLLIVAVLTCSTTKAQDSSTNPLDGFTPAGLQAGTPAGSFPLSGFDIVNPYNGNLNFNLPLLKAGGRGSAGYTLYQSLSTQWTVTYSRIENGMGGVWEFNEPTLNAGPQARWYSPGMMVGRMAQENIVDWICPGYYDHVYLPWQTLTRLTFVGPDGTSYEFRDQQSQGAVALVPSCATSSANRGKIFTTNDGQSATFISDDDIYDSITVTGSAQWFGPSGFIKWKDGTVHRIDLGDVTWIRDRNGNKTSFNYVSWNQTIVTDSLNRQITIDYSANDPVHGLCNRIKYKGFGGADRTIWIKLRPMSTALRSGYSIQNLNVLFPLYNASNYSFNPYMPTAIVLPNGQQYKFYYNSYSELARLELPTGGAFEYDWAAGLTNGPPSGIIPNSFIYRRVLERRVYSNGGTGSSFDSKTTYSRPESYDGYFPNLGYVFVNQYNSSGTLLTSEKHYYHGGGALYSMWSSPTSYSGWQEGKEYQTEVFASNGTTILQRTNIAWAQRSAVSWWSGAGNLEPEADPIVTSMTNTLVDVNKVSQTTFAYDQFNNRTTVNEYDFGVGAPGPLVRTTTTSYLTTNPVNGLDYGSNTIHIRNLPAQRSVYGSGEKSRTTYEYDNYASDTNHAGLVSRASISGLDAAYTTGFTTRGNPTGVTSYLLSGGSVTGSTSAFSQYDIAGNVVKNIDARGNATIVEYTDRFGTPDGEATTNPGPTNLGGLSSYAFATRVNRQGQIITIQFDYYLGWPVDTQDVNGIVTSGYFDDSLDRATQIKRAVGTSDASRTLFTYDDPNRTSTTTTDLSVNNDGVLVTKTVYDQLGRTSETRQYEGGTNYIVRQTQYDALGRAYKASNPFRPWQSETAVWTTQAFDSLGRVTSITNPDNAVMSTSYSGNSVTVTDPAGKARRSVSDALGRVVEVYEDPNGLNYQTTYLYDVLDCLVKVTQGSQQRFFMYDSLKRLIRSRNPEQGTLASLNLSDPLTGNSAWSTGYQYDANGNLTQKTDPRGVVSTYAYDAFNRNTTIDYSDTASINPDVKRFYDGAIKGVGRFWYSYTGGDISAGSNVEHTAVDSYDALGRALVQRQLFKLNGTWGPTYQATRSYNVSGGVTSETYPSGHTVNYAYDAAGRISSFTGNLGDGTTRNYATNVTYSPFGGLAREQFGTTIPLYHKSFYNIRGQIFDTRLSSVNDLWDWNRGRLILYYSSNHLWGQSGTDNNGNIRFAETWIPPENATLDQSDTLIEDSYTYDALNRLSSVAEQKMSVAGGWGNWTQQFKQTYTYDRYGNRTINTDPAQTWGTGINNKSFTVDTGTNRLGVPGGQPGAMTYDTAGNLTTDTYTGVGNRTYDAENRMITAADNTGQTSRYTYDAEGKRTRRQVASSQEEWQIYGIGGELLAEYRANAPASAPEKEYGYRHGELLITATGRLNVALAENGAVATASSAHTCCGFSTTGAINGNNRGPWSNGEGWNDATQDVVPDWIQVDFAGSKTIDEINVFSLHDNYTVENTPTETQTFSLYGLLSFNVQYWNGSSWVTVPGGSVTGNNKVWRKFTFSPITTGKIRVYITSVPDSWSRVVEIQAFGTSASGDKVQWSVSDHLGTPRMIVDESGTLASVKRHDYLPFGEELFAPAGGRSTALGYSSGDGVRQQFTQKERDDETGLDYFGARYYSSIQGRFTGVDPAPFKVKHLLNPQDLNRYSYVANNPLIYIDPNGEEKIIVVIQTFIPFPYVEAPGRVIVNSRYFEGDNRDVGQPGGFRTQQIIIIETDPNQNGGNPLVSASKDVGITHELSGPNGEVIGQAQGSGSTLEQTVYRDQSGAVVVNVKGDESNPMIISPGITYDLKITVTSPGPTGTATVQVSGAHDGFPAYEIAVSRPEANGSQTTTVYSSDPRKINTDPNALFPPLDVTASATVNIAPPPPPPPQAAPPKPPAPPRKKRGRKGRSEDDD